MSLTDLSIGSLGGQGGGWGVREPTVTRSLCLQVNKWISSEKSTIESVADHNIFLACFYKAEVCKTP
jgi:hypothetical protein